MIIQNGLCNTERYHIIEEGNNELTAKLSSENDPASTKYLL